MTMCPAACVDLRKLTDLPVRWPRVAREWADGRWVLAVWTRTAAELVGVARAGSGRLAVRRAETARAASAGIRRRGNAEHVSAGGTRSAMRPHREGAARAGGVERARLGRRSGRQATIAGADRAATRLDRGTCARARASWSGEWVQVAAEREEVRSEEGVEACCCGGGCGWDGICAGGVWR
jgi:hypothetical protein